jgi:hypothetical protein
MILKITLDFSAELLTFNWTLLYFGSSYPPCDKLKGLLSNWDLDIIDYVKCVCTSSHHICNKTNFYNDFVLSSLFLANLVNVHVCDNLFMLHLSILNPIRQLNWNLKGMIYDLWVFLKRFLISAWTNIQDVCCLL